MTDTTRESVERLARLNESRSRTRPHAPLMSVTEPEPLGVETAIALRAMLARVEAAEAEMEIQRTIKNIAVSRRDALQAKLAVAMGGLKASEAEIDGYIATEYPGDNPVQERYRQRDYDANPARIALTADTYHDPRVEGWNAAIEAARQKRNAVADMIGAKPCSSMHSALCEYANAIHAIPCPYQPKEKDDE